MGNQRMYESKFSEDDQKKPYIILETIGIGNRFVSPNTGGKEFEKIRLPSGEVIYKVLGYAETLEEGQLMLEILRNKKSKTLKIIDTSEYDDLLLFLETTTSDSTIDIKRYFEMVGTLKEILTIPETKMKG